LFSLSSELWRFIVLGGFWALFWVFVVKAGGAPGGSRWYDGWPDLCWKCCGVPAVLWWWCFAVEVFGVSAALGSGGGRGGDGFRQWLFELGPLFSVLLVAVVLGVAFVVVLAVVPCPDDSFSGGVFLVLGGCFGNAVVPAV
jgi:hypothetical protein